MKIEMLNIGFVIFKLLTREKWCIRGRILSQRWDILGSDTVAIWNLKVKGNIDGHSVDLIQGIRRKIFVYEEKNILVSQRKSRRQDIVSTIPWRTVRKGGLRKVKSLIEYEGNRSKNKERVDRCEMTER